MRPRPAVSLVVALVALAATASAALPDLGASPAAVAVAPPRALDSLVVGFEGTLPTAYLEALGARVVGVDPRLGFAVLETKAAGLALVAAQGHPDITFVETNGLVRSAAATWDSTAADAATWDAATWDAATWDAARWDSATWDAARWDAASWDAATWDAATWDAARWDAARWDAASWDGDPVVDPAFSEQWHLGAIGAPAAWERTSAFHSRTICVVDSGIDSTHSDLARNVRQVASGSFGYDFVNEDHDPTDDGGHGTNVAGIAAAVTGNGHGVAGVSQAYVIAAKVLDSTGVGTDANLARGIAWCADNGADIVLLALHADAPSKVVEDAIAYASDRGALLLAASGNAGLVCKKCVSFPASDKRVVAVGASAPNSTVPGFSNGGAKLEFVAPGVRIPGLYSNGRFAIATGTSQATAVAAGVAALVWSIDPTLKAGQVRDVLTTTAIDDGPAGFDESYGHGHLRADRAIAKLLGGS